MAGAKGAGAGCGFMGIFFLVLIGMCTSGGSGGRSGSDPYSSRYTPPVTAPAPAADTMTREWFYIHGTLNVRSAPDEDAPIVRTLSRGNHVQLGPKDANGWAHLSTGYPEGYVYRASDLVRRSAPAAPQPVASGRSASPGRSRRSNGYYTGPRGGCYYYSSSGRKQYVDRSYCN
jgi:hypothetical protein